MDKMFLAAHLLAATVLAWQQFKFDLIAAPSAVEAPVSPVTRESDLRFDCLVCPRDDDRGSDERFVFDMFRLWPTPAGGEGATVASQSTRPRPVVFVYATPDDEFCVACERLKHDISRDGSPLDFRFESKVPNWVDEFPTLHWRDGRGYWRKSVGWDGLPEFEKLWDRTERASKTPSQPAKPPSRTSGYPLRPITWTHPGVRGRAQLIDHMLSGAHRGKFRRDQLERLNESELESLHCDDHEGTVNWSRLSGARTGPSSVGAVAALGYRTGSFAAGVAARAEQVFLENLGSPPAMGGLTAKESKKGWPAGSMTNARGFANS